MRRAAPDKNIGRELSKGNRMSVVKFMVAGWACLAAGIGCAATPEPAKPLSVQDLVVLQRISDIEAAPDGSRVSYTVRTTDLEANKGRTSVWIQETSKRGGAAQRVSGENIQASAPQWGKDGRSLYFLSARSGTNQVWRTDAGGGDAVQVTDLPLDVGSFRVSPAGDRLFASLAVYADCPTLSCTRQRLDAASKNPATGVLHDRVFVRHWDAWSDGRRSQLFSIALGEKGTAAATPVNLTAGIDGDVPGKPFGGREDYAVSPDGRQVAFSVRVAGASEPWSTNFDIYVVPAGGGAARNLTAGNPAADAQPAYSPDGSQLAYLAQERPGFESDRFHLVVLDLASGAARQLTQAWDRSIASFAWSRDGATIYATADHLGQRPIWAVDVASGHAAAITGAGSVDGLSVGAKGVFYLQNSLSAPSDLYSVGFGGGRPTQLTALNKALLAQRRLGESEQFSFPGWHDETVFGYVIKPAGFKAADAKRGQKYPLALLVHGGPQGSMANEWLYRWNAQTFAGAGYAVVTIDFHGSTGYGQSFTDSISGDWGGKPLEDLKAGLAAALKQYPWIDGSRACALGGSYGGYMMNWILGAWPDRFKCLVSHAGIVDNRSMYYMTEELWFEEWEHGGPEYQNPAGYGRDNPVDLIQNWKTPTLVIAGEKDYRVPYTQGLGVFTALQRRGIPSEFLYFPDENHWVLKPANSIQWYDTVLAWLAKWNAP